jgi:hypothetical protein
MNYYTPWIDPRVSQVRSEQLDAYLRQRAWSDEGFVRQYFHCYRHPTKKAPVYVPTLSESDDQPLRIFEAVTELALIEGRYAGDVLTDLLAQTVDAAALQAAVPALAESGEALAQQASH